ncbi:response regulator [Acidobacteria bacterium AB60]|nr:response regulator [Acidobacteria bacterium AB60]
MPIHWDMDDDQEVVREFLVESNENLARLDQDMVALESRPQDGDLLASVFRTIHTIKGTCGFLGFMKLEKISHQAESLLSQLREGKRRLDPAMVSLILETVDATRKVLSSIEANGSEGGESFEGLEERLRQAAEGKGTEDVSCAARNTVASAPAQGEETPKPEDGGSEERPSEATSKPGAAEGNIRVGVGLLDKLMDLVGELVLVRNQILQFTAERDDLTLGGTSQRLNLITTELQEGVMKTRMQPIGVIWNKLPRVVRDLAVGLGKQIRIEMDGAGTELDRTIIEAIKDPLVHLVRNACDHGVERSEIRLQQGKPAQGTLTLRAYHEGGQVNIEIGDDGAGIDAVRVKQKAIEKGILLPEVAQRMNEREAINLIFRPGFTTAGALSNISGRGVGMDVVKTHIEKIGGTVEVSSRVGEGTTVKLKIPLTLAIIPGLVVSSGGERFVIPQVSLLELIHLEGDAGARRIEHVHGTPVYRRRGKLLPIAYLNRVLSLERTARGDAVSIVVLQADDRQYGLVVDGINDTQEIVVKPLGKQLKGLSLYAGATIMGDGRVALILDVHGIGQASGVLGETQEQVRGATAEAELAQQDQQRLLLFRSGAHERIAIPLSLVGRLEEFPRTSIEHAGDTIAVQYRARILPLIVLRELLESAGVEALPDPVPVIVFDDGERQLGLVVDQIVDIAEQTITIRQKAKRGWFLGSAVVNGRVTDFLDVEALLRSAEVGWSQKAHAAGSGKAVLVGDRSAFTRGLMRGALEMSGYAVREAGDLEEAMRRLEEHGADAVLVSENLPPDGAGALTEAMRRRAEWSSIPVMEMTAQGERLVDEGGGGGKNVLSFLDSLSERSGAELVTAAGEGRR